MDEIKRRIEVIDDYISGRLTTGRQVTDGEFVCLQFRKVLELIALSSLAAHRPEYETMRNSFTTDWNARRILEGIQAINPSFYPVPGKQVVDEKTGRPVAIEPVTEKFLDVEHYYDVFDQCSKLMHAFNPYGERVDVENLRSRFPEWRSRIVSLLNHHQIQLAGSDRMLVVIMQTSETGQVQVTEFLKLEK